MKNKLLITTALATLAYGSNAYAAALPTDASDLTSGNYVVEHENKPVAHNGDVKISQDATLTVETYAPVNEEEDQADTSNIFRVNGNLEIGDEQNGGGKLTLYREDNEKPMMSVSGGMTVNEGAVVNLKNDDGRFATILVNTTTDIKGGELNLDGGDIFTDGDVNISGGNINITQGEMTAGRADNVEQTTGNINITSGQVNLTGESSLSANGTVTVSGGELSLQGTEEDTSGVWGKTTISGDAVVNMNGYASIDGAASLAISGGTVNVSGESNVFGSVSDITFSDGVLNVLEGAELNLHKLASAAEDAEYNVGTIVQTGGEINLSGTLDGNIAGSGAVNILRSNAVINGGLSGSDLSFEADHSLSKAISGEIGEQASLNVNKGTLTYDRQTGKISSLNVAGGLDIGTNTVNATNVEFKDNSNLALRVSSTDSYGNINADNITIGNDTTMKVTIDSGIIATGETESFDFLQGTVTGDFTSKIAANNRYDISYKDGKFDITGTATASDVVADAGGSSNNASTAEAWDSVTSSSEASAGAKEVASVLNDLSQNDGQGYVDALTAVAPEVAPMVQQTQSETANQVFGAVGTRLTGGSISTGSQGMSSGDSNPDAAVWVQGMFNKSKLDDTSKAKGFDADSNGVALGIEKYLNKDVKAGIGYAYTNTDIDGFMRSTDVDTHTAILYGEYKPSNWYVNGIATYGWSDYEENKSVAGVGVKADYDVETFGLQAMTGYDMQFNGLGITPEAGLRYVHIKQDAYTDSADQRVSGNDSDILTGVIGAKVSRNFELSNGMNIKPEARIAATYDLMNDDVNSVVTLANGSAYAVDGEALNRFGMEFGVGLITEVNDKVELSLGYKGKFREDYQDHTGLINAKYKF